MHLEFAFPLRQLHWWLIAAGLTLALVTWLLLRLEARRRARMDRFVAASLAPRLLTGYDAALRRPLVWLTVIGCASLALAFAQPHWGQAWQEVYGSSRDVMVLFDVSESMRATNPAPSRLERAKQKVLGMLERMPGDRFGLIAFAGAADLQCPLTMDHAYFRAVLATVDPDSISRKGTDIAGALREAKKVFSETEEKEGYTSPETRAILLISDGEQVSGDAVEAAKEVARYAQIIVMGVGSPEGVEIKAPELMGRYRSGAQGPATHMSKLDEDTLRKIAAEGNGVYTRALADTWDLDQIVQRMDTLSARAMRSDVRFRLVNRYQWPLGAAVLCFAAEGVWLAALPWIRQRRMRRQAQSLAPTEGAQDHA